MYLTYLPSERLPTLAWALRMTGVSDRIDVYHGSGVETRDDRFFEGAWNGPFPAFEFADATVTAGTGAVLTPDGLLCRSASDMLSPLFSVSRGDQRVVSNSPVFAISLAGDAPRDAYPFHPYHFLRIWRQGFRSTGGSLKLKRGGTLGAHFGPSLLLRPSGALEVRPPPATPVPRDFAEYEQLLSDGVRALAANARDPARRNTFRLLAAVSADYDSCAAAALAAEAGCKEALTFCDSSRSEPRADSGLENARYLGMTALEYDRDQDRQLPGDCPEVEFASFPVSSVLPLAAAEDALRGRLLVTGYAGGYVWEPERAAVSADNQRTWLRHPSGLGQVEFRLRVGFIIFTPAGIASNHAPSLARIARSEEMRPWSIGGPYDRPIPRRIAESRGLPRKAFGQHKMASSHQHLSWPVNYMPATRAAYEAFVGELHASVPPLRLAGWKAVTAIRYRLWKAFSSRERRNLPMTRMQRLFPFLTNAHPRPIQWTYLFTFQWAFNVLKARYAIDP